jgi:protein-S-isoprenylcysteine O-methyltransferase Ste14
MTKGFELSLAMLAIVLFFFVMDFWYMNRYDRERKSGKGWSWDYTLFILVMTFIIILQPWLIPRLGWTTTLLWGVILQIIGGILVFLSFGLHIWARHHLRRFYTERVEVQQDHQMINSGPYAMIRHPIITTFFGLAIGVFLINPSLPTLAAVIYTFLDFLSAAKKEEQLLLDTLPDYAAYMAKTPPFLPRLWKKNDDHPG